MPVNPKLQAIMDNALKGDDNRLCSAYSEFKDLAKEEDLWMHREIDCRQIIPHHKNREGAMATSREAMDVWNSIDNSGVVPELWDDATAFELGPKGTDKSYQKWCEKIRHDPEFPDYPVDRTYVAGTVACTHLVIALNQADQGMAHTNSNLCHEGKLSLEAIKRKHPLMEIRNPWNKLRFVFWKKEAEEMCPDLPTLARRALNLKYQTQQGNDSFSQFILAAKLYAQDDIKKRPDVKDWVAAQVAKISPKLAETFQTNSGRLPNISLRTGAHSMLPEFRNHPHTLPPGICCESSK